MKRDSVCAYVLMRRDTPFPVHSCTHFGWPFLASYVLLLLLTIYLKLENRHSSVKKLSSDLYQFPKKPPKQQQQ